MGYVVTREDNGSPAGLLAADWVLDEKIVVDVPTYTVAADGAVLIAGTTQSAFEECEPRLPRLLVSRNLPRGSTLMGVQLDSAASAFVTISNMLPVERLATSALRSNCQAFSTQGFYPADLAHRFNTPALGDRAAEVGLNITPVQYNSATGQTRIWTKMVFHVQYSVAGHNVYLPVLMRRFRR